jgi:hypothetical protein
MNDVAKPWLLGAVSRQRQDWVEQLCGPTALTDRADVTEVAPGIGFQRLNLPFILRRHDL